MKKVWIYLNSGVSLILLIQLIQKCYPLIDNYFIGQLGSQALLIHNIYVTFALIAQYVGYATATTCLILWQQNEYTSQRDFGAFFVFTFLGTFICFLPIILFLPKWIDHFHVSSLYVLSAVHYLWLGSLCTIIFSGFYYLVMVNNGIKKYALSLYFTIALAVFTIVMNWIGVTRFHWVVQSLLFIIFSKIMIGAFIVILFLGFSMHIHFLRGVRSFWRISTTGYKILLSELSSGMITALYPIIFIFQLAVVLSLIHI